MRYRRAEDGLLYDVLKVASFTKTKRRKRAGTHVRVRNELGQWMSYNEGVHVGVSESLPQSQDKKGEETKTEETKTNEKR